jgi:SAM-dependent methyltransferase
VAAEDQSLNTTEHQGERQGPLALATKAQHRILAWPRYDDLQELERLFQEFGRPFVGREDVCLCMRVDPEQDGHGSVVLPALLEACGRALGEHARLEILLIDGPLGRDDWTRLGEAVNGAVLLRSSAAGKRSEALKLLKKPLLRNGSEAAACIPERSATGLGHNGLSAEQLAARVEELQPWFYPLRLRHLRVTPGKGTSTTSEAWSNIAIRRSSLIVDEVVARLDLVDRSLLDLGCNCGFFAAHYVARGVSRVVGIDGREQACAQAELFFSVNEFLPEDSRTFHHADVCDPQSWEYLHDHGPFDLTLCAGLLHHLPGYRDVLTAAAKITREALVVDTRVTRGEEKPSTEPEDTGFNSLEGRRQRLVPNLDRLLEHMSSLGFQPEVLPVFFGEELGLEGADSYASGARVVLLGRRA